MFRPHLSPPPTLLDSLLRTLRHTLGARTDLSRASVSSTLFLSLFIALLLSPSSPSVAAVTGLTLHAAATWGLMMVVEWDGPTYSHGKRVGRLPAYLLGVVHLFFFSVVGRVAWCVAAACYYCTKSWVGLDCLDEATQVREGSALAGFVRLLAGICLAFGLGLMHLARKSLRKGAGIPHLAPPLGPTTRISRFPSTARGVCAPHSARARPNLRLGDLGLRRTGSVATLPPYSPGGLRTPGEAPPAYCE